MMITVTDPLKEPRVHLALPCGFSDLEEYTQEVVRGVHDHNVRKGGWSYSYHDRLTNWPGIGSWDQLLKERSIEIDFPSVNQINELIKNLAVVPHSRRAQATTWVPFIDAGHHEPPCLQRIWGRVVRQDRDNYLFEMNTHWRSRDAFKAAFMNMFALTELQRTIAQEISNLSGKNISVGRYVDISDSYHIYGSYLRKNEIERFLEGMRKSNLERRTARTDGPAYLREKTKAAEKLARERKGN